jgi:peptidoglycan/xylan/chitin deacetylase (PgdA/CDA1 family)
LSDGIEVQTAEQYSQDSLESIAELRQLRKDSMALIPDSLKQYDFPYSIPTWKNGAKGAYAIIFDDFCDKGTWGIQDLADTIAHNRGVKIGFGVITSLCDEKEWQRAREMIRNGHEVINHTHTHRCGVFKKGWCEDVWDEDDYPLEIDTSNALILENTGIDPVFFIFPYDLANNSQIAYLKSRNYIGARTGPRLSLNKADFSDPFKLAFDINFPTSEKFNQRFSLNEYISEAIATGGFALREVHGVDDNSWGVVHKDTLTEHFDLVKQYVESHELWNDRVSAIINYRQAINSCFLKAMDIGHRVTLKIEGEADVCQRNFELSFAFTERKHGVIFNAKDVEVKTVNGYYNMKSNQTYYFNIYPKFVN